MRILLALLFTCLVGCMAVPPTTGGVFHNDVCAARWQSSDFPLHIAVDRRLSPERQDALQEAVLEWNEAAGATVFTIDRFIDWYDREYMHRAQGWIYILVGDLPDIIEHGVVNHLQGFCDLDWHTPDCTDRNALITLDVAVPNADAMLVFKHELGHALGLEHDNWQPSIMWPYARESGNRILPDDLNFVHWEMTHGNQANPTVPSSDAGEGR